MKSAGSSSPVKRGLLLAFALVVLLGLWYAFRPEKLFINKRVDEAAPTLSKDQPTPLFTGRFQGDQRRAIGRATVYQSADGTRYVQLTAFSTSSAPGLRVLLMDAAAVPEHVEVSGASTNVIDLGQLKAMQGDQSYAVPAAVDLGHFDLVTIYCARLRSSFGVAKLQVF